MPSPADLALPLTEDDWETLEEFLDQPGGPDLDTAVGFLTAVVTAPSHIPPSAWIPMVLGDRELQGQDDPALGLVLRMFNTISKTMSDGRVFHPDADQVEEIERWCKGYVMGIDLDDQWIDDVDALKPIFPFFVLAGEHKLNEPGDDAPVADEEAWKQKARKDLGGLAFEAFELLAAKRRVLPAAPGDRVRESPKVGRNAPCPCRSGKKYKKCCGR